MKNILILSFILFLSAQAFAQKGIDTASFSVNGICGMCEDRIENAAYIKGVKKVDWDKDTQKLTVIYKPKKVSIQEIAQSVADAGHDNEYAKASAEAYKQVHNCCKYREQEVH